MKKIQIVEAIIKQSYDYAEGMINYEIIDDTINITPAKGATLHCHGIETVAYIVGLNTFTHYNYVKKTIQLHIF